RGLAGAAGAVQGDELTLSHAEGHVAEGRDLHRSHREDLPDPVKLNHRDTTIIAGALPFRELVELCFHQLADHGGVGLAAAGLHDLADDRFAGGGFALTVALDRSGIAGDESAPRA